MIISTIISKLGVSGDQFRNVVTLTYMLARHYFGNLNTIKPSAVIGGIPLGTVVELSHGISDREIRYRSNGGIFLAHQDGGNESLRIIGQAWGPNRFLFLNMLEFLFIYGSSTTVDVISAATVAGFPGQQTVYYTEGNRISQLDLGTDPWQQVREENMNEGYKEQHMTFPVITKDRVYLSMFIETYSWRQRLDVEGRKMIEYTIFFRKYEPEEEYEYAEIKLPANNEEEAPKPINVYRERAKKENPMIYLGWKSSIEMLTTLAINFGDLFNLNNITKFGQQFQMNYFGIDDQTKGRIPGIIERRGFF